MRYALILCFCFLAACSENKPVIHTGHVEKSELYYSCSMHPQVMASKPGNCPICNMPLTAVVKSKVQADELELTGQQIQLGNIGVDTIRSASIGSQTVLTAVLNFDHTKTSAVSSRVMGRVERLYFKNVGDYIRKGDRLYDLYSEELNNAKEEYVLALKNSAAFIGNDAVDFHSLLRSGRNKLSLWGMSNAQINQLTRTGKATTTTAFYSNTSGYVTSLDVRQGDYVMEGGTIVQLADLSSIWAEAQVFSSHFSQLQQNASVDVRIPALADEAIKGSISFVNPEVLPQSRLNLIRVSIPNKGNRLKPGMLAYVHLDGVKGDSFRLPVDAVLRDSKGATIWIKVGKNTFKTKMVTVGAEANGRIEIRSGLVPGDVVVITGAYLLNSEFVFKKGTNPMDGMKM